MSECTVPLQRAVAYAARLRNNLGDNVGTAGMAPHLLALADELKRVQQELPLLVKCFRGDALACRNDSGMTCCQLKIRMIDARLLPRPATWPP